MPTQPQLDALGRTITALLAGFLLKYGMDDSSAALIAGLVMSIGTVVWGVAVNRLTSLLKSVEASPTVEKVVVTDPLVAAQTGPKVVLP